MYGIFIVDPDPSRHPEQAQVARSRLLGTPENAEWQEMVMMMNAFDTNFDGENEVYAANTIAHCYLKTPIRVVRSRPVRIYLVNIVGSMPSTRSICMATSSTTSTRNNPDADTADRRSDHAVPGSARHLDSPIRTTRPAFTCSIPINRSSPSSDGSECSTLVDAVSAERQLGRYQHRAQRAGCGSLFLF